MWLLQCFILVFKNMNYSHSQKSVYILKHQFMHSYLQNMIGKCITKYNSQNTSENTTHTYTSVSFSREIIRYACSFHTVLIHSEFCCTPPPGCSTLWDDLNCWPHAEVGETVSRPCPILLRVKGLVHPWFSQTSVPEFNRPLFY